MRCSCIAKDPFAPKLGPATDLDGGRCFDFLNTEIWVPRHICAL
jgi:hypothetical protein